jgi:hypothetical protein
MAKEFAEKIPITVYGTDTKGEMFVEDTSTVVVAREWITVPIRKRIPPGSEVIVFNKTNGNQAEFQVEDQDGAGIYRARLKDLTVDVWERDFGVPPDPVLDTRPRVHLVCKSCGTQESVQLDPDEHARVITGDVLWRRCPQCVEETDWQAEAWLAEQRRRDELKREEKRRAAAMAAPEPLPSSLRPPAPPEPPPPPPPAIAVPVAIAAPPPLPPAPEPEVIVEAPEVVERTVALPLHSFANATWPPAEPLDLTLPQPAAPALEPVPGPEPVPEPAPAPPPPEPQRINWAEKRTSRRIQMKTRARVRRTNNKTEVVAPLNVSRGGIAFESVQQYDLDERIQVAMHYREGEQPLETLGSIVRVTPREKSAEYGVKFG